MEGRNWAFFWHNNLHSMKFSQGNPPEKNDQGSPPNFQSIINQTYLNDVTEHEGIGIWPGTEGGTAESPWWASDQSPNLLQQEKLCSKMLLQSGGWEQRVKETGSMSWDGRQRRQGRSRGLPRPSDAPLPRPFSQSTEVRFLTRAN